MTVENPLARDEARVAFYNDPKIRSIFYQVALCAVVALLVYSWLQPPGTLPFGSWAGPLVFIATAAVYYVLNTLSVGTIIALASGQPLFQVYRGSFRTLHWVHFITLPLGAVLAALWYIDRWLAIPAIVPLIMAQRSFKAIGGWQSESRRNKELAAQAQQLAGKLERLQDTTTAMIGSLDPLAMLETVSARLAALLEAPASWVVLLDGSPRLAAIRNAGALAGWDPAAYGQVLAGRSVRQIDARGVVELHGEALPWQALVIIPLALENHVLGGICLAFDQPIALAKDDRRVLLAFGV